MKAGTRHHPHQYSSGSVAPTKRIVLGALNAISEYATGQAGIKYFETPLTDRSFAGDLDCLVAILSTPTMQGDPRTFTSHLAMTQHGGMDDIPSIYCSAIGGSGSNSSSLWALTVHEFGWEDFGWIHP